MKKKTMCQRCQCKDCKERRALTRQSRETWALFRAKMILLDAIEKSTQGI